MENIAKNRAVNLKEDLHNNDDIIVREIKFEDKGACLVFLDGIVDIEAINLSIIKSLNSFTTKEDIDNLDTILLRLNSVAGVEVLKTQDVIDKLLKGYAVLFVDDIEDAIGFNVIKYSSRSIEEPPTSMVIKGPREGFNESIKTNISLIRKRLLTKDLKIESFEIGEKTKTQVKIAYLVSIADDGIVKEIKDKLKKINIDGILDSYYISKFLEDRPNSIFRQVGLTEKPDICCSKMLEGRVAVFVDGSPIVLTIPYLFMEDLQSSNDYYSDAHRASLLRVLRLVGMISSVLLPGFFIALQLFHYKVLPLKFLVTIINTTQNLPLNPFLEILFIMVLFEILFEASIRMPKYLGVAISIVGALILGDTAVKAGLVSPPGVMIVAIPAISGYCIPDQNNQIFLLRAIFAVIGGVFGFQGLILAGMFLVCYMTKLDSFKTAFLAPFSPYVANDQKDFIFKQVITEMKTRPESFPEKNNIRLNVKDKGEKWKEFRQGN